MDNLLIRKIKVEDADDLSRIQRSIVKKSVNIDFKRIIEEQIRTGYVGSFVAELEGEVVGFMISYTLAGGFGIDMSAWIAMLGVDPKYMGQGIGKSLAKETFRFFKELGIENVYTSVRWDWTDILSFLKTLGFDRSDFMNLRKVLK